MGEKQETIADILEELRSGEYAPLADRIEAAMEREKATAEKSSAVGNAAKMREALELAKSTFETLIQFQGDGCFVKVWATLGRNAVVSALVTPPKNCNVGTADEQYERWRVFCGRYAHVCEGCPFNDSDRSLAYCFARWAQMPYEEGGAE